MIGSMASRHFLMRWGVTSCGRLELCCCRLIYREGASPLHCGAQFPQSFGRDGVWERHRSNTTHHLVNIRKLQWVTGRCTLSTASENETAATTSPDATATNQAAAYLSLSDAELLRQCDVDTYRASGPGGQHRNKTESAVRLRHKPTGCVSQSCEQRSQHMNRETALGRLRQAISLKGNARLIFPTFTPFLPLMLCTMSVPDHWIRMTTLSFCGCTTISSLHSPYYPCILPALLPSPCSSQSS